MNTVEIAISDISRYEDWDEENGYGGDDQILTDNSIIVSKSDEQMFRKHIKQFEEYVEKYK